jgi:hypothetical protein
MQAGSLTEFISTNVMVELRLTDAVQWHGLNFSEHSANVALDF